MRRRAIRAVFLALFVICAALWAWSYPYREHLSYNGATSQEIVVEIGNGCVFLGRNWGFLENKGWQYYHVTFDPSAAELDMFGVHFLGFRYFFSPAPPKGMGAFVTIPFWFLTGLCAAAACYAWRSTKRSRRGFPIEPTINAKPNADTV